jgi:FkbM family methyltransferase
LADHPYRTLPDYCFWRRSISDVPADDVDPVIRGKFKIRRDNRIATAGSCFAQHIARHLSLSGFNYLVTETAHPLVANHAEKYNYGVFTARYGNIYTSRQFVQTLKRAYGIFIPHEDAWSGNDGRVIDPFRPQIQPGGFASMDELLADRRQHLAAIRRAVEELDVFVFTLGLTETWVSRVDGAALPLCPGVAGGVFDEARYVFLNLPVQDVIADLADAVELVRSRNVRARLILTVSPVPLVATMENRSVLVSTTYSKSVLRVAAEEIAARYDAVAYFPSYEIITGNYTRGNYFAADLRSVTEAGVSHVMRLFMAHYAEDVLPASAIHRKADAREQADRNRQELEEIVAVMCDEVTLDIESPPTATTGPVVASNPIGGTSRKPDLPRRERNLALGKPANQSSLSEWSRGSTTEVDAAGAVNGIITGRFQFHTAEEQDPWWCVDLVEVNDITEIRIFNRCEAESLAARLLPFSVFISVDGRNWSKVYSQTDGSPPGAGNRKPLILELSPPVAGRRVKVQRHGRGFLHLDQVEVYGRRAQQEDTFTTPMQIHVPSEAGSERTSPNSPTQSNLSWPFDLLKNLGRSPRNIIHIGANSGQEVDAYKAFGFDWAVLVEPLDAPFERLCKKIAGTSNFVAVKGLCSAVENMEHDFHISSNEGASSSMLAPKRHLDEHPEVKFDQTVRLRSTTVDILCREVQRTVPGFQASFLDFMVLDTQGSELSVLKGAYQTLHSIKQIWTEVSHGGLYENDVALEDLQAFLCCFGFRLYFVGINIHGYGDALFLKS